jgi:uncharacterized membrane protein YvlD (DUF360 family)
MLRRSRTHEQFLALFVLGALLLLPPILVIFSKPVRLLYLYLFFAWAVLIGMAASIVRNIDKGPGAERTSPDQRTPG